MSNGGISYTAHHAVTAASPRLLSYRFTTTKPNIINQATSRSPARIRFSARTRADLRRTCATKAAELFGARLHLVDLPDNGFDTRPLLKITQRIEDVIRGFEPTIIYTHSPTDLSRDHQLVAQATAAAARPVPGSQVRTVLSYEVRSATDWGITAAFQPTWYQPLNPEAVKTKMEALRIYSSEMRAWPHTRSAEAVSAQLAHRGAQIGVEAAEAFGLIRHVA